MDSASASPSAPWIVGLDLGARSHGALVLAGWLRAAAGVPVLGLHVLEAWASRFVAGADEATDAVRVAIDQRCARLGIEPLAQVEVMTVPRAEEGLASRAEAAAGLIVGRAAPTGANKLVRLGRVARRVLRQLPGPVIVAPPELAEVADGPVLLASELGEASAGAVEFAKWLAGASRRALELVHVGEPRHADLIDELDPRWLAERESYRHEVLAAANAWSVTHGLGDRPRHLAFGDPAEEIAGLAAQLRAALVVVGSRRLGPGARLFSTSTASALAGLAGCPVAVVPPA